MKIGIFDSGIGGLSVLHNALKVIPNAQFIYYADTKNVPYGEKSEEEIKNFVDEIMNFFVEKQADAVVIACNTASSVTPKKYREQFPFPIIGMEPAVKKAIELHFDNKKRILVAATPITVKGKKLHSLLERVDTMRKVDLIALPKLVRFAENRIFSSNEIQNYLKDELGELVKKDYSALVLGCTHFNYFKSNLKTLFPYPIYFVDGNEGTINQLLRNLPPETKTCHQSVEYYFSGKQASKKDLENIECWMQRLEEMYKL